VATTLVISAVDAETDDPVPPFVLNGKTVAFSVIVLAVKAGLPGAQVINALDSLAGEPANGPIGLMEPADKSVVGTVLFGEIFFPYLTDNPRIYRTENGFLSLPLYPTGDTAGWIVAPIPVELAEYDIEPVYMFVEAAPGEARVPFTLYKKDLSPLAREVLEKRAAAKPQLELMKAQWGGESPVVWDMVHNFVENTLPPKDERLAKYWINDYSWTILDEAFPARQFDLLVERYDRMRTILADIPFPDLPYFEKCALYMPITVGVNGVLPLSPLNHRLFVPVFSAYFPRTDAQIKTDLGALWMANLPTIFECVIKKLIEAVKEAEKTAKFWKITSTLVSIALLPTPANIFAGLSDVAQYLFIQNKCSGGADQTGICNPAYLIAFNAAVGLLTGLVSGGETLTGLGVGGDAYEKAVGFLKQKLEGIGVEALKEIAKDADKLKALVEGTLGTAEIPPELKPFLTWCLRVTILDVLIAEILSSLIGGDVDPQTMITGPMIDDALAAGVPVSDSLLGLVNGDDPDFPAQTPFPVVPVVAAGVGIAGAGVLGYLWWAGKL